MGERKPDPEPRGPILLPGLGPREFRELTILDGKNKYIEPDGDFHTFRLAQVGKVIDSLRKKDSATEALLSVRLDVDGTIYCYVGGNFKYASMVGALEILKDHLMRKSLE